MISKVNKMTSIILCGALVFASVPSNVNAASKPTVTKKMTINIGQSKTIKVTGKYIKSKTFKSNKKSIATVTKKGKVTGKSIGTAKITVIVKYKKSKKSKKIITKKYTCTVTVNIRKSAAPINKPVITEEPNVTQAPSIMEEPKATPELPKNSSKPQNTPDVPVVTEIPSNTDEPSVTETPESSEEPHNTEVPSVTDRPQNTPNVPVATETPVSSEAPQSTEVPSVTNEPQSTSDVPVATETPVSSEEPHNTEVPSVTNEPQSTPNVPVVTEIPSNTDEPSVTETPKSSEEPQNTEAPSVTETPEPTMEPTPTPEPTPEPKKYDYTFSEDGINIGIVWEQYPSTTQKGIYKWYNVDTGKLIGSTEIPTLDSIETIDGVDYGTVISQKPSCTDVGYREYYDLNNGRFLYDKSIPATGHTSDEIWHTSVDSNGEAGDIWNECTRCGENMNNIGVYFKENNYTYTKWLQTPSETQEGIMGVYSGVNIKDMTTEQLEEKYDSYDVVFDDGTKDTYYGDIVYKDNGEIQRFDVYAKSTVQQIGTLTFPKYEVVEIDLGNGEKTKVYGYYDRNVSDEMYTLLNEYRKENGLNELIKTDDMQSLADIRSAEAFYTEMYNQTHTDYEYIAHERPNKTRYSTVYGYNNPLAGENETVTTLLSKFQASGITQAIDLTAEYEMNAFKSSEGHNYNLLYNKYTHVGMSTFIGYPQNPDGTFKNYKVAITIQVFDYKLSEQE